MERRRIAEIQGHAAKVRRLAPQQGLDGADRIGDGRRGRCLNGVGVPAQDAALDIALRQHRPNHAALAPDQGAAADGRVELGEGEVRHERQHSTADRSAAARNLRRSRGC